MLRRKSIINKHIKKIIQKKKNIKSENIKIIFLYDKKENSNPENLIIVPNTIAIPELKSPLKNISTCGNIHFSVNNNLFNTSSRPSRIS